MLFSDESSLGIEASAKLKVLGTDAHGAQVAISDGAIDVMVKPRKHSSWRFEAGPFSILVKGTAFRLGFDAAKGRMDLLMKTGVVEVRAPREDRVLTLRAGESLQLFASPPREVPVAAPVRVTQEAPRADGSITPDMLKEIQQSLKLDPPTRAMINAVSATSAKSGAPV